jgi:hypothetical protein
MVVWGLIFEIIGACLISKPLISISISKVIKQANFNLNILDKIALKLDLDVQKRNSHYLPIFGIGLLILGGILQILGQLI